MTSSPFGIDHGAPDGMLATPAQPHVAATEISELPETGEAPSASDSELTGSVNPRQFPPQPRPSRFQHFSTLEPPRAGTGAHVATDAGAGAQTRSESGAVPGGDEDDDEIDFTSRPDVRGEVGPLIDSLKALFEQDRGASASGGSTRCGLCYLHFPLSELEYREREGYYICGHCVVALGSANVPMVRRQQR